MVCKMCHRVQPLCHMSWTFLVGHVLVTHLITGKKIHHEIFRMTICDLVAIKNYFTFEPLEDS